MIKKMFNLKSIEKRGKLPLINAISCYGVKFCKEYINGKYEKMMYNQRVQELKEMMNLKGVDYD